jgi:hypothetical protein
MNKQNSVNKNMNNEEQANLKYMTTQQRIKVVGPVEAMKRSYGLRTTPLEYQTSDQVTKSPRRKSKQVDQVDQEVNNKFGTTEKRDLLAYQLIKV